MDDKTDIQLQDCEIPAKQQENFSPDIGIIHI